MSRAIPTQLSSLPSATEQKSKRLPEFSAPRAARPCFFGLAKMSSKDSAPSEEQLMADGKQNVKAYAFRVKTSLDNSQLMTPSSMRLVRNTLFETTLNGAHLTRCSLFSSLLLL